MTLSTIYLSSIVAQRRKDVRAEKYFVPLETLQHMVAERTERRDFASAIASGGPAIIAEIKRASPAAGPLDLGCDAAAVAREYERGGASAISVLTEPREFRGSFADLARAREAVNVPVLCKDFIVDEFQIWKAVAFGADAVLLIVATLDDDQLRSYLGLSRALGVSTLVEVHGEAEAGRAVSAGATIIGVNNRDLQSFAVETETAPRIAGLMPRGSLIVAESGYRDAATIRAAGRAGIHAVLVGEVLMRASDRVAKLRELRGVAVCSR